MKLFYFATPNSRKSCAVARYLNSNVEYVHVDLSKGTQKAPEFLALNPNGKVPALQDGDEQVWESNAIMCYLADKAGSDLWPRDERAVDVIRWLSWDTAHFSRHAGALYFQNFIKGAFGLGEPDQAAVEESTGFFRQFAGVLDAHLAGKNYIVGNKLSVVDFAVAAFLPDAAKAKLPLAEFPQVVRWHGLLSELACWPDPFPEAVASAA
jgi:glutathione S-transferase